MNNKIRVRFAPSPTGMLHIGGARTAIFNYLFAKKNNADFVLRIEDTDKERSTKESIDAILDGMKILGLNYDEIYYQSENKSRHQEIVQKLLAEGKAYEDSDPEKGTAIRIKIPAGKTILNDLVRGQIEFDNKEIEDFVLLRSDGSPTYNLAVVVDDMDMQITHIIRGDDHIANTPKQIALYEAIGAKAPEFAHLPMIHDIEGKKLSKRKSAVAISDYIKEGYTPQAICNYLLHLGSYGCYNKDIISIEEAVQNFDLSRLGKSPSRFDFDKLKFINLHYIKETPDEEFLTKIKDYLKKFEDKELSEVETGRVQKIIPELKKIPTYKEIVESLKWVFENFDYKTYYRETKNETEPENFVEFLEKTNIVQKFKNANSTEEIKAIVKELTKEFKPQEVYQAARYLIIGRVHSFGINLIIDTLGSVDCATRASCVDLFR